MKILTSKAPPSIKVLAEILKMEFSDHYSYKLFGLGKEKSIIVKKSTFVGAQISICENGITIEGVQPSIPAVLFSFLLQLFTSLAAPFSASPWRKLEWEIGSFLKAKYNQVL